MRDCLENPTFRRILRTERQERGGAPRPGFSPTRGLRESVGKPLGGGEVQPDWPFLHFTFFWLVDLMEVCGSLRLER